MQRLSRGDFAELNELRRPAARREQARILVPGYKCITELLRAGHDIEQLLLCGDTSDAAEKLVGTETWQRLLREERIFRVRDHEAARLADQPSPEGLLAVAPLPASCDTQRPRVILDGVSDPGNLGSILRTALWFGLDPVGLLQGADVWSPRVIRSAMGAQFHLQLRTLSAEDLETMKAGGRLLGLDSNGGTPLQDFVTQDNDTLIMGSESHGLQQSAELLSERVWIPGCERAESLNVGHAFAICAYHYYLGSRNV